MNKNPKVDAYMAKLINPLKAEMEAVREIILNANPNISEDIKWAAPSFFYKENMCTFNPRATKTITLIFHKGSLIEDKTGILQGEAKEARTVKFKNLAEVKVNKANLEKVIKGWIKAMDTLK